ncbi:unnamed protein product [Soboliphyme baturini]|uniref:Peptidase S1 domain-containing protein n=1 Tax=Soboliphyme baturini TaxID=241478 RepID=A0A183J857_9BILA|nr:unnamed protein product [Soboliphyme baturini]
MPKKSDRLTAGDEFEITGYGPAKTVDGRIKRLLRSAVYVANSSKECSERFPVKDTFDPEYESCGYPKDPSVKVDYGDSGGPVARKNVLQAVIHRKGDDPALGNSVIFSDIVAYSSWLQKAVNHLRTTEKHGVYELSFGGTLYHTQAVETVEHTRKLVSMQ